MERVFEILKEAVTIADKHGLIKNQDYLLGQSRGLAEGSNQEYTTITFIKAADHAIIEDFVTQGWTKEEIRRNQDKKILLKKVIG